MALTLDEVTSLSKWEGMREEWTALQRSCDEDDLFLTFEWLHSWWRSYGEGRRLRLIVAREGGELVGVAPLMVSGIGKLVKLRITEFLGTGPSDHLGALVKEGRADIAKGIWEYARDSSGWDVIDLKDMREGGSTASAVNDAFREAEREETVDPYIPLGGTYESYMQDLSKSFRHNVERSLRRLHEEHSARVELISSPERLDEGFEILLGLNALRWQGRGTSTLESPLMRDFLRQALGRLAPKGHVAIHVMYARGSPISITLGFYYRTRYLYYLSGFNPEYHSYGPGRSLLAMIIEDSFGRGLSEVDLLRGTEDYKFKFNPQQRNLVRMKAKGKGVRAGLSDVVGR